MPLPLKVIDLGVQGYEKTWTLQEELIQARYRGEWDDDALLFVEHPHVFTLGRRAQMSHLLDSRDAQGGTIPVFDVNRGGDITYHGPGQIVGYPLMKLETAGGDIIRYLRDLEEVMIRACADFGIVAERRKAYTGVWVDGMKIASIGVGVQRGITLHGFALNVAPDMSYFERIVPCGIQNVEMTSMSVHLGRPLDSHAVRAALVKHMGSVFSRIPIAGRVLDLPR